MARYTFIKGHYTATYDGANIGTTKEGFVIRQRSHTEPIPVDESGDVPVDGINRGTEYAIEMRNFVEFGKVKAVLARGTNNTVLGAGMKAVGSLQSELTKVLVLTPDDTTNNRTYTAPAAIVEGDVDIPLRMGLKQGSMTFICYPDPNASTNTLALAIQESGGVATN